MNAFASIIRHVIAPAWAAWERSPYLRHSRLLRKTQFDKPVTIRNRQWNALRSMIDHAYEKTEFYRSRLQCVGMTPEDIDSIESFRAIPLLTKDDLRNHSSSMISDGFDKSSLRRKSTSGSTGVSVEVFVDEEAQQFKRACTLRSDEWTGWRLGERKAMIWGNPEYLKRGWRGRLRNTFLDRECYLDTLKMTPQMMLNYLHTLQRKPPSLMLGHAHSLYLFAQFVQNSGGAGFQPNGIISTAMVLCESERSVIEDVFHCPVTNRYGCEEVSLIACECEEHKGLHINCDGVYVEIVRTDGSPAEPGELGAVIVTDLANRAMPMIRYQIGDMAVLSDRTCRCGRGLPLLEKIEGRVADYVVTPRGELISGISLTENFAMLIPGIKQLQIVQEAVDRFLFRIVRDKDFGHESTKRIQDLVEERFGPGVIHQCEFVERIPQEPSGKYRFCISKVENPYHVIPNKQVARHL